MDFSQTEEIKTIKIIVGGFAPLSIKYGLVSISKITYLIWNVIGTSHIFKTNLKNVTANHHGHYEKHFVETLVVFRKDLLDYFHGRNVDIDMSAYLEEFAPLIKEI